MNSNDNVKGLDLSNWKPDYTKTKEENDKAFRDAYFNAYGEYPPEIPEFEDD